MASHVTKGFIVTGKQTCLQKKTKNQLHSPVLQDVIFSLSFVLSIFVLPLPVMAPCVIVNAESVRCGRSDVEDG